MCLWHPLQVTGWFSRPYEIAGKTVALYILILTFLHIAYEKTEGSELNGSKHFQAWRDYMYFIERFLNPRLY
jgi:hypothetical protein